METNDEGLLRSQFARYNQAMELVADTLQRLEHRVGETASDLASRLEATLQKRVKRKAPGDDAS